MPLLPKSELNAALDAEQAGAAEHIVVDVPPEEPTRLEIWRRWGRNNVPTIHYFCPEEKYPPLPRAEAMAILAEQASNLSTNVCLEIFLPISMLANDIDQWQYATFEGVSRLGERHAVAVRWRERARDGVRLPQWQTFAATLEQKTFEDPVLGWLEREHIGEPTFSEEIMRGRWGDFLAFSFIPFDADMQTPHNQLKSALGGGMAYGLWVRREPTDWHAFRELVAELFGAGDLNNMPARIKTARCVASKHDDNQNPFRNLTLFWDEPRRNPWSRGRLTEPGQKFRVE